MAEAKSGALTRRWIVPPFTVLDARSGRWQRRKDAWFEIGIGGEAGRDEGLVYNGPTGWPGFYEQKRQVERRLGRRLATAEFRRRHWRPRGRVRGTSVFDPVLAELACRWFCPPGGSVLDPFGGESVKGLVAAACGHDYTGVELRGEQVRANRRQARRLGLSPTWITGDAARLDRLLPRRARYDLAFTSPPYYDLEVYSRRAADGSAMRSYRRFMEWLAEIFVQAAGRLRDRRFFVVKLGEVRDRRGRLRDFVGDCARVLRDRCGLAYLNDAVLVTAIGSLAVRAGRPMATGRKLGRGHQHVLAFFSGDPREVRLAFPDAITTDHPGQAPAR